MPGLLRLGAFVGTHLAAPGVGADGGNLVVLDPLVGLEAQARRVATGITLPLAERQAVLHLAGAHDHEVAAFDLHALFFGAGVEIGIADAVAVFQIVTAQVARDVQQNAAAHHAVARVLNAILVGAVGIHQRGVVAVPHLVAVEHMAQCIPLRIALQRHRDHVVGIANLDAVLAAGHGVGAGGQHGVDGIEAATPALLRAGGAEVQRQREDLAPLDQAGGARHVIGRHVVERADLVVRAPLAPVLHALGHRFDGGERHVLRQLMLGDHLQVVHGMGHAGLARVGVVDAGDSWRGCCAAGNAGSAWDPCQAAIGVRILPP